MLKFFRKTRRLNDEQGIGIPEVMVSVVIIAIVLVATAATFIQTSSTSSATANRNQAIQFSQDIMAVAKQAPWQELAIWTNSSGGQPALGTPDTFDASGEIIKPGTPSTCSEAWTGSFNGKSIVKTENYYPKLSWCQSQNIPGTDQSYTAYTYITYVLPNFDGSSASSIGTGTLYSKKVTVKVVWFEGSNAAGEANWTSVTQSFTRTPTIQECVPYNARDIYTWNVNTLPPGCKYNNITAVS